MRFKLFQIRLTAFLGALCILAAVTGCFSSNKENQSDAADSATIPQQLVVRGLSKIMSGDCRAYAVAVESSSGANAVLPAGTQIQVRVGGPGSHIDSNGVPVLNTSSAILFSDDACSQPSFSVNVDVPTQSELFYLKDYTNESLLVYASTSDATLVGGAIAISTFGATKLALTSPPNVLAGICSTAFTLNTVDPTNAKYVVLKDTNITFTGGAGSFYLNPTCAAPAVASAIVKKGDYAATFYYKGPTPVAVQPIAVAESGAHLTGMSVNLQILKPAMLSFTNVISFGTLPIGVAQSVPFTIANAGEFPASNLAFTIANSTGTFHYLGNTFPGTGGTCQATLAKATSCTVVLEITPTAETTFAGTLSFIYNNGVVNQAATTTNLSATGFFPSGALDTGFGVAGKVTTNVGTDAARSIAIQSDGKIIVVSSSSVTSGNVTTSGILVSRFTAAGALDTTFNTTGNKNITSNNGPLLAGGVAVDIDGSIIVVGSIGSGASTDFDFIRLNSAGAIVGQASFDFGGTQDNARAVFLQPDEKIVVAGVSGGLPAVMRVTSTFALDTTFNTTGFVTFSTGQIAALSAVTVDGNGRTIVAGTSGGNLLFARLQADGSQDPNFNAVTNNTVTPPVTTFSPLVLNVAGNVTGLALTSAQRIAASAVLGAATPAAVRVLSTGTLDTTFGTQGIAQPAIGNNTGTANGITIQSDGKFLLGGRIGSAMGVIRLNTGGAKDTTFGANGFTQVAFAQGSEAFGVAIQPGSNRIILGGTVGTGIGATRVVP